ncbi:transcription regulator protein BACH1-like [Brachionichthys hirsutus]|uniref:transcription regulator protein BACH1-like n=1 Tax=Brachionichthys hirsutus TaxID=412623 RepID=UPI003604846A
MLVQAPRTSVFTFDSAVHSAHVLQCLDDQRLRDFLCDVTVVVGNKRFRAHRSVLASCSVYFHSTAARITSQNPIITLSDEVSIEGFEPLLQFAYTSKLPFTKENFHAIRRSAEFLGFHNLESAHFDFLIPKFSEGKQMSQEARRSGCSQSQDPGVGIGSGLQNNQPKALESRSSLPSRGDDQTGCASQCPRSARPQTYSREEALCLENCGPQMTPLSPEMSTNEVCPMLSLQCPDSDKGDHPSQFCEGDILEMGVCHQSELTLAGCGLHCELSTPGNVNPPEPTEPAASETSGETLAAEAGCSPGSRPLATAGAGDCSELLEQSDVGLEQRMAGDLSVSILNDQNYDEGLRERSSVEREVAEHMANILGFWSNLSEAQPLALDHMEQNKPPKTSEFHCLKQLDLSSSVGDCPFLNGLDTGNDPAPLSDSLSQSEQSPYMSSSLNSGDDSDLDTDGDTEANNRRAAEMQLPFPVQQISTLNRSAFQQLLRKNRLNQVQLEFVHDIRRRSKNRVAAQRCRKRKLEGIHHLEYEIKRLASEKERLLQEQTHLEQNLEETRQSLCRLCKSVTVESGSDHDCLQLLTKLSSEPVPASPCLAGKDRESQIECDASQQPERSGNAALLDSSSQHGYTDPVSPGNACLGMNNVL